jgi:hypothetical protein
MKQYQPSASVGSFAPSSFASIMDVYRALQSTSDPAALNASSITAALNTAKDVPLFMGGGKTFTCDHSAFTKSPSVCTGAAFLVQYKGGNYSLLKSYDASQLLQGIS